MPRNRNNIFMSKLQNPTRVDLPSNRTFYTKYKRATKNSLSNNATLTRRYRNKERLQGRRQ